MRSPILRLLLVEILCGCAESPPVAVRYEISFPNATHHEAEIRVTFDGVGADPLEIRMSRTSPGRYALHEFAKNVYDFRATGADGRSVEVTRPDNHQWDVHGHGGSVTVTYTLYGDRADGTYAGIDRTHAHLNMPATFVWARGLEQRPVELTVRVPEASDWRVATQLAPTNDPVRFTASDLQYFLDSPTEVSDHWRSSWDLEGQSIGVALHHAGTDAEAAEYAVAVRAIVGASRDVYGALPRFDEGTYTFLACYLPWASGDGMEHRNSTVLTSSGSLAENMTGLLGTVAHEFFHAWNVERIRPASLEPFDFEAANMSRELWFAEGFTSYFDDLILWRAGVIDEAAFAERMGGIANSVVNAPGRRFHSPVEMSMQAPFVDAATSVDPTNGANTFLSYYTWGSAVALGLDLTLRTRFEGLTLDHLMREMWSAHGVVPDPYDVADIEAALAGVTGDAAFARDYFDRYVRGRDVPDFAALLDRAGIELARARPGAAWIGGSQLSFEEGGAVLTGATLIGAPLYEAGLDRGDRIVLLDGRPLRSRDDLASVLAAHLPGDVVDIRFAGRGATRDTTLSLAEDPTLAARLRGGSEAGGTEAAATGGATTEGATTEAGDREAGRAGAAFRAAWKASTAR